MGTAEKAKEKGKAEGKPAGRGVAFCPKCGSTDVFWASGLPQLWSVWECRSCGYRGAFIVRDGGLAEKPREDFSKKSFKR
jgi:predicted RNA-binding Zn-ribbon protein involved in translation (DUF1610 family)